MAKIMLVDDDPDLIFMTEKMLGWGGHEVVAAYNGQECLDKIKEEKPDLVLLDIMMPDMDGWEVGRKIKEDKETNHIPIVMFTVMSDEESKIKSFEYSKAEDHICKPVKKEYLVETVERVLRSGSEKGHP